LPAKFFFPFQLGKPKELCTAKLTVQNKETDLKKVSSYLERGLLSQPKNIRLRSLSFMIAIAREAASWKHYDMYTANNITLVEEQAILTPIHVIDMAKTLEICKDINSSREPKHS
jgi:hypothetical protein